MAEGTVPADGDRLTLALDALIENAVSHTDVEGRIELSARREGENVVLAVTDSGCGIPAAELGRIFARFSRIESGRDRSVRFGLGLALVKAIAEAHGGSVHVQSEVGHGSTFELHLPGSIDWIASSQTLVAGRAASSLPAAGA